MQINFSFLHKHCTLVELKFKDKNPLKSGFFVANFEKLIK